MDKNKRLSKRITAGYKADITYKNNPFQGVIENLSETGMSITVFSQDKGLSFTPGEVIKLKFEIQPGEVLDLNCTIKWAAKLPPHGLINGIGLEIIAPNWAAYNSFL